MVEISKKYVCADIEADGLYHQVSKIYCLSLVDYKGEEFLYTENNILEGLNHLSTYDMVVMHNGVNYDRPVIQKLHPWWWFDNVFDTMITSRLIWTYLSEWDSKKENGLDGSHSLEAWGKRLGVLKGDYGKTTDWKEYTSEMGQYCLQDSRVTKELFKFILTKNYSIEAIQLEHEFAEIISRQEKSGFYFDIGKALKLKETLADEKQKLLEEIAKSIPPTIEEMKTPEYYIGYVNGEKSQFRTKTEAVKNKAKNIIQGPLKQRVSPFNPNSRTQIANYFISKYKWEPQVLTETGRPKVDEDILESLDFPEAKLIARYMMIVKRWGQLVDGDNAWLKLVINGRIHGSVITNGAVTGRCTHFGPNMAQIPSVDSLFGHKCRDLFCVPLGYKLVGCDASGLEARCKAHFMYLWDKGEFVKIILEGNKDDGTDIHSINAKALGLSRSDAKTWYYGFMYGAGNEKLGKIAGKDAAYGEAMKQQFFDRFPALKNLITAVQTQAKKRGYLIGLDGRHLHIRSEHAALNTLLQSAGALVMKLSLILLDKKLQKINLRYNFDYFYCANVHDEFQLAVRDQGGLPETVGKLAVESIKEAGEYFKFNCPLDGEYKIGQSWADTH